jgi:hypothetical protein
VLNQENKMKIRLGFVTLLCAVALAPAAEAGNIHSISYADLPLGSSTTDLTAAGSLDWVKWSNNEPNGSGTYATPEKVGSSIIDPTLTPLGSSPPNTDIGLFAFAPAPGEPILEFTWTDGTEAMGAAGRWGRSSARRSCRRSSAIRSGWDCPSRSRPTTALGNWTSTCRASTPG